MTVGGSGRIFSRAFTRLYLTPQTRRELEKNPTVNPPGVKTSFDDLYGVVGLSPSKHKEDLRHRAAMHPVSFHRNVVGDDASTMTSTAERGAVEVSEGVWIREGVGGEKDEAVHPVR